MKKFTVVALLLSLSLISSANEFSVTPMVSVGNGFGVSATGLYELNSSFDIGIHGEIDIIKPNAYGLFGVGRYKFNEVHSLGDITPYIQGKIGIVNSSYEKNINGSTVKAKPGLGFGVSAGGEHYSGFSGEIGLTTFEKNYEGIYSPDFNNTYLYVGAGYKFSLYY